MSNHQQSFIEKNASYWAARACRKGMSNGFILVDCQYDHPGVVMTNMHVAKMVQQRYGHPILALPSLRSGKAVRDVIGSYENVRIIDTKRSLLLSTIKNSFRILGRLLAVRTPDDLLNLEISGVQIGRNLYDAILIRRGVATIDKITTGIRRTLALELGFFFMYAELYKRYDIKRAVIGDKEYRYGFMLKLALRHDVPSIAAIDGNTMAMRKYETIVEQDVCPRRPTDALFNEIKVSCKSTAVAEADRYIGRRFSADDEQHDIKAAFSKDKLVLNRRQFYERYSLDPDKKLVAIMSHVFPDAPHSQENILFRDYWEWLTDTLKVASSVHDVNWMVKPHPSAKYYRCDRTVEDILRSSGLNDRIKMIDDDVNTISLINSVDSIVTCGGTAGLEFACNGLPVVIAARTSYSGFGFTYEPGTREEYARALRDIAATKPLSKDQVEFAKIVMYIQYVLMALNPDEYEYVLPYRYFGIDQKEDDLFERAVKFIERTRGSKRTRLEALFHDYLASDEPVLIDKSRLFKACEANI